MSRSLLAGRLVASLGPVAGIYAVVGGIISFCGWVIDDARLTDWNSSGISIQPNATLCVTLSGLALLSLALRRPQWATVCGTLVLSIGVLTLMEWLSGISIGIDELLMFGREWGRVGVLYPGRMGPPGSMSWSLIGAALMLTASKSAWRRWASVLAIVTAAVSALSLVGYTYGAEQLYSLPRITIIALQTSTFIFAISIGIISYHPEREPLCILLDVGSAGWLARRALPVLLLIPPFLGWLRIKGQGLGLYDTGFGTAMLVLALSCLLSLLLWWSLVAVRAHERRDRASALEKDRAQQLVAQSQELLSSIIERCPFGIYIVDADGHIVMMNEGSKQGAFRNVRPVIGRRLDEAMRTLWPEPLATQVIKVFNDTLDTGESYYSERFVHQRDDIGRTESYEWELHRITFLDGRYGVVCYYYDSTRLRQVEQALRTSEARYRTRFELSNVGKMELDAETGKFTIVNDAFCRIVGYSRDELVTMSPGDLTHPEDQAWNTPQLAAFLRGESDHYCSEKRLLRKDGQTVWAQVNHALVRDAAGEPLYSVGVLVDVSDRKRAEELIRESESLFRLAASAAKVIVYEVDLRAGNRAVVHGLEQVLGVRVDGQRLDSEWWHARIHPDDLPGHLRQLTEMLKSGLDVTSEYRVWHEDGRWIHVEDHGQLIRNSAGDAVRMTGLITDISTRKQTEEDLRKADRRKNEFLATLAHELRNPLSPLLNGLEMLQQSNEPALVRKAQDLMRRQLDHMVRLIDDLLDVSRISRDRITLKKQCISLQSIAMQAIENATGLCDEAGHELIVRLPTEPVHVEADPVRLTQVFGNLLSNACKYTTAGTIWFDVQLESTEDCDCVVIRVRDTGIGISPKMLPQVFEMFTQVDSSLERAHGGLGIGLSSRDSWNCTVVQSRPTVRAWEVEANSSCGCQLWRRRRPRCHTLLLRNTLRLLAAS